ncbi:MAG: transglutaminase-like domain-containing protein [Candidatus Asgardarchaeia archaeon]
MINTWRIISTIKVFNHSKKRLLALLIKLPVFIDDFHQRVLDINCTAKCRKVQKGEKNKFAYIKINEIKPSSVENITITSIIKTKALSFNLRNIFREDFLMNLPSQYTIYIKPQRYWDVNHPIIQKIAKNLSDLANGDLLYYIVNTFKFVINRIKLKTPLNERRGAIKALELYEGDCDELSDVFITLLRAKGIPSRRVVGYFIKSDGNEYTLEPHAWSEVLVAENLWIPFDPALHYFASISEKHIARYKIGIKSSLSIISSKWKNVPSDKVNIEFKDEVEMAIGEENEKNKTWKDRP